MILIIILIIILKPLQCSDKPPTILETRLEMCPKSATVISTLQIMMFQFILGGFSPWAAHSASADELPSFNLTVKNAHFVPETFEVPAGKKFQLVVKNEGPGAEEFESTDLNREKVVAPGKSITLFLGPLAAGAYEFFGDFHRDTAKGKMTAK